MMRMLAHAISVLSMALQADLALIVVELNSNSDWRPRSGREAHGNWRTAQFLCDNKPIA